VKGETALHLICQFGNKDWLEWAIQGIGPRALYDIRHELPLTGDTSNLQLCQQDIYETIKNYNRLFDTFHYLVNKFKMNVQLENQPEFKKRFNDFCQCFNSLQKNTKWQESTEFCAKKVGFGIFSTEVGGTYHDLRFSLKWATKEEREEFGAFLSEISTHQDWKTKPASMVAKMIVEELDKLNPKPDAQVTIHAIPPLGAAPIDGGFVVVQPVVPVASAPDLNLIDNGSSSNVSAPPAPPGGPTVRNGSLGR
jgi:hypothetical protein